MLSLGTLRENLAGAWSVMRSRPEGLSRMDLSIEGFWRSFGAIILLIPFAILAQISQEMIVAAADDPLVAQSEGGIGAEAFALIVDWFAFPLVFALMARPLGVGARYVPFIVTRNWASVIIAAMVAVVHAAHIVGLLPSTLAPYLLLVAVAVALRFSYVIARATLGVSAAMALPIVALDLLISLTVWSAFDRLVQG